MKTYVEAIREIALNLDGRARYTTKDAAHELLDLAMRMLMDAAYRRGQDFPSTDAIKRIRGRAMGHTAD